MNVMNKMTLGRIPLACVLLIAPATYFAQQVSTEPPSGGAPAADARAAGRGGAAMNPQSNEQGGVDIDRFIGDPSGTPVHLSHHTLLIHSILKNGDPYKPGLRGAVLEYRKELATATLLPHNATPVETLPDEFFFYVKSGEGRLDDGKQYWDLRQNIAVLAPPNVPHRIVNTGDKPLDMIMLQWTAAGTPGNQLIVRDVDKISYCEENAHWNNTSKCVFGAADGLFQSERFYLVMLQPWAMSQPHSHGAGTEEIWTKVTPGKEVVLIGSEIREVGENGAYLVPPTGFTEHGNLNLTKDRVDWWIYTARGAAPPAGAPPNAGRGGGGGRGGRGGGNPNLSRNAEEATVPGKPLR
jgi:mannose-6-phosphate isomerase-like protein (cupin superfamily)